MRGELEKARGTHRENSGPLVLAASGLSPENFRDSFHKALSLLAPPLQRLGPRLGGASEAWQESGMQLVELVLGPAKKGGHGMALCSLLN